MANLTSSKQTAIYVLNRDNYETFSPKGDNIFFVRDNSADSNIISLYVGRARQCDVLDITNICRKVVPEDDKETIQLATNKLMHTPIFPKTVQLWDDNNTIIYTDNGNNKIVRVGTVIEVGSINYVTGKITYNDNITPALYATYAFSTVDLYSYDDQHTYNIDEVYRIPNKLFLYEQILSADGTVMQTPYYRTLMWEPVSQRFLDCSPEQYVMKNGTLATIDKNIIAGNDMPLKAYVNNDSTSNGEITLQCLPRNGSELRFKNSQAIEKINIADITKMEYYQGSAYPTIADVPEDYISVLVFKKDPNVLSVTDLMGNFNTSDQNDSNNTIYLINPDKDIQNYTVIHILLYNDGFNICAVVAGYESM